MLASITVLYAVGISGKVIATPNIEYGGWK
jgi:hypothetical protein